MANKRLFGTDGVRGIANEGLTAPLALQLGMAAGYWMLRRAASRFGGDRPESALAPAFAPIPYDWPQAPPLGSDRPLVIIGRDTRISGDMLEGAVAAGLAAMGVDVVNVGVAPTPAVAQLVLARGAAGGVVISASHNPFEDNGIKFFGADGRKLPDSIEDEIEANLNRSESLPRPHGAAIGRITETQAPLEDYVSRVAGAFPGVDLGGLDLVVDCANGAAYRLGPAILQRLGASVTALHAEPDGLNINVECGSTKPQEMAAHTASQRAHAGLAFDGDADRVIMADERGRTVDGDRMMAIIALHLHRQGRLPGDCVVATIMSNIGLEQALAADGIRLHRTDVGDRYVAEAMENLGAAVGGEQSGHILLPHLSPAGDGIVTGLQVLAVMRQTGKPLSELADVVQPGPQLLRNLRVKSNEGWREDPDICRAIEQGRARLGNPEWLSVRPSGTEPLIRVMAQGMDEATVNSVVADVCTALERRLGLA